MCKEAWHCIWLGLWCDARTRMSMWEILVMLIQPQPYQALLVLLRESVGPGVRDADAGDMARSSWRASDSTNPRLVGLIL